MSKEVYKNLLDILKIENNLDSDDDWTAGNILLQELWRHCDLLCRAIAATSTDISDKRSIFPKVLKTCSRILSKFVSLATSQVKSEKGVCSILECLNTLFSVLAASDSTTRTDVQMHLMEDQTSVVMLYLQLLTIFESSVSEKQRPGGLEDELLLETSLLLYYRLLSCLFNVTNSEESASHVDKKLWAHKLYLSFEGPLASQTVLSLLYCMQHRAKRIAASAAADLLLTLQCFPHHREVWRACYPGTFSGLFVLTQSGFKSGSALLVTALSCLLQITHAIAQDAAPENAQLLHYLHSAAVPGPSPAGLNASNSKSAFAGLLAKVDAASGAALSADHPAGQAAEPAVQASDRALADGFSTVQEFLQWRVQLLQRIQLPLAVAFREVFKECGPKQRCQLVRRLASLLRDCSGVLGSLCTAECVAVLLSGTVDPHPEVRSETAAAWVSVQSALKSNTYTRSDAYMKVIDSLGKKYLDVLQSLRTSAAAGNEERLGDQMRAVLGIGSGMKEHIVSVIRAAGVNKEVLHSLRALFQPDAGVCGARVTASVLETRQYTYRICSNNNENNQAAAVTPVALSAVHIATAVAGGYCRVAWQHLQGAESKDLARRLALFSGRHGLLEGIITLARKSVDHMLNDDSFHGTKPSITKHAADSQTSASEAASAAEVMSRAVGAFRLLNDAVLGLAAVKIAPAASGRSQATAITSTAPASAPEDKQCKRCGKLGTQMLRCSRCKAVHYCTKQHQAADWPEHKVSCKAGNTVGAKPTETQLSRQSEQPLELHPVLAHPAAVAVEADLDCPSSLLSSAGLCVLTTTVAPTSSSTGARASKGAAANHAAGVSDVAATEMHLMASLSEAHSSYSAAKRQHMIQQCAQLCVSVIKAYLDRRQDGSDNVSNRYALLVATATEGLANIAYNAGPLFGTWLMECLFPLLELLVDGNPLAKQAAQCTLDRIALYVHSATLPSLIRRNLDYIVDKICLQMRIPAHKNRHTAGGSLRSSAAVSTSTHLIVDFVFSVLDTQICDIGADSVNTDSELAPLFLLRDVICDALENIDAFSAHTVYHGAQLQALLRVLRVLACRAAPAPSEQTFLRQKLTSAALAPDNVIVGDQKLHISPLMRGRLFGKDKVSAKEESTAKVYKTAAVTPRLHAEARAAARSLLDFTTNLFSLQHSEAEAPGEEGEEGLLAAASRAQQEGDGGDQEQEQEQDEADLNSAAPAPPAVQLLLDVISRCCTFLTLPHPASQLLVIETMGTAFVRLSLPEHTAHLLPCVHTTWPVVINRVRELRVLLTDSASASVTSAVKGRRKVTTGSSALLGLEGVKQEATLSSALTAITSVAKAPLGGVTAPSALTLANSGPAGSALTASAPHNSETAQQRARLHVLPALLDLVAILTVSSAGFMTNKLKQEFLPEAFAVLSWYQREYAAGHAAFTDKTEAKPLKVMSRSDLLVLAPSAAATAERDSIAGPASPNSHASRSTGTTSAGIRDREQPAPGDGASKHSLHSQVKAALLSTLLQLCEGGEELQRLMQAQAAPLVYLAVPLLSSRESDEVRQGAKALIQRLRALDPAAVDAMLACIVQSDPSNQQQRGGQAAGVSREQALAMWAALQNAPSLLAATASKSSLSGNHHGEQLLGHYHRDKALIQCVHDLLQVHNPSSTEGQSSGIVATDARVGANWLNKLSAWSVV